MVTNPDAETKIELLNGETRTISETVTTFHLALVVLDPFTKQSAWLLATAQRILATFAAADVRVGFVVTGTADEAKRFLGPLVDEFIVFVDPDRALVKQLGLERLPAWIHLDHLLEVEASAQGWDPDEWRAAVEHLAERMSWLRPEIPIAGDPAAFSGSAALT